MIGLGKLGGDELNYSSDVDLLFLHAGMGRRPRSRRTRVAAADRARRTRPPKASRYASMRRSVPAAGRTPRRSLEATFVYYERESAMWERQAMIKARPVAGRWTRRAVRGGADPARVPGGAASAVIDDVRRTKVRLEEYIRQRGKEFTEVKRGRGGIRDIEFAVQLLQIVHGRREPSLRSPTTLAALRALATEGYVSDDAAEALADAYRFLRRLEHRLQIVRDLQTHELPPGRRARTTLARSLGSRMRTSSRAGTKPPPASCVRSMSACSTDRCWRRSPDPRPPPTGPIARPPRNCWRAGVRRPGPFLRRAGAFDRSIASHRQGAGPPVPGDGAVARALAGAGCRAPSARTDRRGRRFACRGTSDRRSARR